jgi:hypothetical protein
MAIGRSANRGAVVVGQTAHAVSLLHKLMKHEEKSGKFEPRISRITRMKRMKKRPQEHRDFRPG